MIWQVSALNRHIKQLLEQDGALTHLNLEGELANFKRQRTSGHCYFSLKDADASVSCVMFRSAADKLLFEPVDGTQVVVRGMVSVYEKNGAYQVYVDQMIDAGRGFLQLQYEALKKKLEAEGVFRDAETRRPLPVFPQKVGLVTSPTGAVIRDMVTVMRRRYPGVQILLSPAIVQGAEGAGSINAALKELYDRNDVDVIILARGGGSQEDLWCFNEEEVVRQVRQSPVPIISAIGHETDWTLCDYAADLRAGTPSIAAEQVVPDARLLLDGVREKRRLMALALSKQGALARAQLDRRLAHPVFSRPESLIKIQRQALDERIFQLDEGLSRFIERRKEAIHRARVRLDALNPLAVLNRGYAYVSRERDGTLVKQMNDLQPGDGVRIHLSDGNWLAKVRTAHREDK